jgi:hypothetical protein
MQRRELVNKSAPGATEGKRDKQRCPRLGHRYKISEFVTANARESRQPAAEYETAKRSEFPAPAHKLRGSQLQGNEK